MLRDVNTSGAYRLSTVFGSRGWGPKSRLDRQVDSHLCQSLRRNCVGKSVGAR